MTARTAATRDLHAFTRLPCDGGSSTLTRRIPPGKDGAAMILLIDNYDSFTFNLYHFLGDVGARCEVWRNDKITVADALARQPEAIVLSPGPCTPNEAGICLDLITAAAGNIPILGVCLGHQAVGQAFGGAVVRAPAPMHGKVSRIFHAGHRHPGRTAVAVQRDALPQPHRRSRDAARGADAHRLDRGRAGDGHAPPHAAGVRRTVPPGKHRQPAWP